MVVLSEATCVLTEVLRKQNPSLLSWAMPAVFHDMVVVQDGHHSHITQDIELLGLCVEDDYQLLPHQSEAQYLSN